MNILNRRLNMIVHFGDNLRAVLVLLSTLLASFIWVVFCIIVFFVYGGNSSIDSSGPMKFIISIIPLILIWLIAANHLASTRIRKELDRLDDSVRILQDSQSSIEDRAIRLVESLHIKHESANGDVQFTELPAAENNQSETRDPPVLPDLPDSTGNVQQPDRPAERFDMPAPVLVRALDFADSEDDHEGMAAIETAMQNRHAAALLESAHVVLIALAGIDIITDDLETDIDSPSYWRQCASMLTVSSIVSLGDIHPIKAVQQVRELLNTNSEFATHAERFIRRSVPALRELVERLDNNQIEQLSDTRSIKALLLISQAMTR